MVEMAWKPEYETGVRWIDDQHRIFLGLINNLIRFEEETEHRIPVQRLLLEIRSYACFHFVSEENLMMRIGYPGLAMQQEQHARLLVDLDRKIEDSLGAVDDRETATRVHLQLLRWLLSHTMDSDMEIGRFMRQEGLPTS